MANSIWDELEEVKQVDNFSNSNNINTNKVTKQQNNTNSSVWDELEEVKASDTKNTNSSIGYRPIEKQTFSEEHPILSSAMEKGKQIGKELSKSIYDTISNAGTITQNMQPQTQVSEKWAGKGPDIVKSIPEAGKQFGQGAVHSYPVFAKGLGDLTALTGDIAQNYKDIYNKVPKLVKNIAKVNNPVFSTFDSILNNSKNISDFGRLNANYWGDIANRTERDKKYQGTKGLSSPETFLPTVTGSLGDQATNILMAMAGNAGGAAIGTATGLGKIGTGAAELMGASIPNVVQEGEYLDKIQAFKEIYGRMPTEEELRKIQNIAIGEKGINSALETMADKLLFNKLFPQGTVEKTIKGILRNIG